MKDVGCFIIAMALILIGLTIVLTFSAKVQDKRRVECQSQGGYYVSFRDGDVCIKENSVIPFGSVRKGLNDEKTSTVQGNKARRR